MNKTRIHLFPDTNLFFQCKDIGELPWSELGDFDQVELIVTRPIQKEIDKSKGEMTTRLGKRARKAHGLLRDVISNQLNPIVLRERNPKILLSLQVGLKPNAALATTLDYDEADDTLVGITSGFATNNLELDVGVLTHDGGVMASAVTAGVAHYAIPETWLAPPEETKADKELRAAQAEIVRLRTAEPKFEVACVDGSGQPIDRIVFDNPHVEALVPSEIEALMRQAREKFPERKNFIPPKAVPPVSSSKGISLESLKGLHMPPTDQQIEAYHDAYKKWEVALEEALGRIHKRLVAETSKLVASFRARNVGTRPAENALVEMKAHGSFYIWRPKRDVDDDTAERKGLPSPPAAPTRPNYVHMLGRHMRSFGLWDNLDSAIPSALPFIPKQHDAEGFYYRAGSSGSDLSLSCDLWRHGQGNEDFDVSIEPHGPREALGAIEFRIHASNLTDAVSLKIPIEIRSLTPSAFDYAEKMVGQLIEEDND
ncbi:hypothetical protein FJV83_28790 [Mesorhizobium sp. WSM4307]|uniref:hypothetical protein n=1 Tax=unclassified Mesorhizobium TaxID=325217 RepID=UPI00115D75E7|nr:MULTISPECIES: hypothetical protein [unclassified Mesorhizobium]TRC77691.1 hypothetical protein FJV80_25380 [Mesorhizobium sp. WSM4310]TRC78084.1 hypothetical protein FJV81_11035 [Mesorhizobium sp. WSM4315]TRC79273.1 hypothetical protein FJV83_28790 [Mesorhizobium sp. WSM4307]